MRARITLRNVLVPEARSGHDPSTREVRVLVDLYPAKSEEVYMR